MPKEWEETCKNRGFPCPIDFNMISSDNTILLNADQSINILFKFLTFRELNQLEDITIGERRINVTFSELRGQVTHTLEIDVIPSNSWIVDYVSKFYEPENRHITLKLCSFRKIINAKSFEENKNKIIKSRPYLECTLSKSTFKWDDEKEDDVLITLKTPEAMKTLIFYVFA